MTMHTHDEDLIMALAEGSLSGAAATSAAESIAGCTRCTEDLTLQREALAALSALETPRITELETARLRRDLDTALGHSRTAAAPTPTRRRVSLKPLVGVAAALLAIVVAVPALESISGGGDDSSGDDISAMSEADSPDEESRDDMSGGAQAFTAAPELLDAPTGGEDATAMVVEPDAPVETTASAADGEFLAMDDVAADLDAFQEELAAVAVDPAAPEPAIAIGLLGDRYALVDEEVAPDCTSGLEFADATGEVVTVGVVERTGTGQHIVLEIHPTEAGPVVVAVDPATCRVIATSVP